MPTKFLSRPWLFALAGIAIAMLTWALNPRNPYGYYLLLRLIVCPILALLAVRAFESGAILWAWTLGIGAAIYNPLIRVHLNREIWSVLNVVTIAAIGVYFACSMRKEKVKDAGS